MYVYIYTYIYVYTHEYTYDIFTYLCIYKYLYIYLHILGIRSNRCVTGHHAVALLVLVYTCTHNIVSYVFTHHVYTSVDLPMPPGPHSTHLFVVVSPLSNQSRMPFSSLDRRWNPFGALTLNTRIAPTRPLTPRAVGARGALTTQGLRVQSTPSCSLVRTAAGGKLQGTPSQRHNAGGKRAKSYCCCCTCS